MEERTKYFFIGHVMLNLDLDGLVDNRNRKSTKCKHSKICELEHFQCHKCLEIEILSLRHEINSMSLGISCKKKKQ